jgi:spore coat protein YutH
VSFNDFLSTYYGIQVDEKIGFDRKEGYRTGNYFNFITSIENKEMIYLEQASLAYYLRDNQIDYIALPIPNLQGEWFTSYHNINYMVMQVTNMQQVDKNTESRRLAEFHQIGSNYQYQPKEISSYGKWKLLWIEKLDYIEARLEEEANKNPNPYYQLVMDVLPYIIGISENAIQYIRESETETRFHEVDQGTITFHRYHNQLNDSILWVENLVYDHPIRDVAEQIRNCLVKGESEEKIYQFLREYQTVRPLSIFSYRLLFGRILFPAHILDLFIRGFTEENDELLYKELKQLLDSQIYYERVLRNFYEMIDINPKILNIPMINWL